MIVKESIRNSTVKRSVKSNPFPSKLFEIERIRIRRDEWIPRNESFDPRAKVNERGAREMLINAQYIRININTRQRETARIFLGSREGFFVINDRPGSSGAHDPFEFDNSWNATLRSFVWVIVWPSSLSLSFRPLLAFTVSSAPPVARNNENGGPTRLLPVALLHHGTSAATLRRHGVRWWTGLGRPKDLRVDRRSFDKIARETKTMLLFLFCSSSLLSSSIDLKIRLICANRLCLFCGVLRAFCLPVWLRSVLLGSEVLFEESKTVDESLTPVRHVVRLTEEISRVAVWKRCVTVLRTAMPG